MSPDIFLTAANEVSFTAFTLRNPGGEQVTRNDIACGLCCLGLKWSSETLDVDGEMRWGSKGVESLEDWKKILTNWRMGYNRVRPHSALGMLTPKEFAESSQRNEVPIGQIFSR